ncbi:hypothetical protein [uncultured Akkermansia sp.]|uniref:hypothetical protein n=1 Tax=uncultured Akkermansia sp. TaxID=512294 RepID=UPI0027D99B42|nr:hypothetical protein [uncultured Akkermansia sp.]
MPTLFRLPVFPLSICSTPVLQSLERLPAQQGILRQNKNIVPPKKNFLHFCNHPLAVILHFCNSFLFAVSLSFFAILSLIYLYHINNKLIKTINTFMQKFA